MKEKLLDDLVEAFETPTFYILVGNIGSGKSTYIRKHFPGAAVVSKDGIRYSLGAGTYIFNRAFEPIVHATSMFLARQFFAVKAPVVILDETNMTKRGRKTFIALALEHGYNVKAIVFPILSKIEAVDRRLTNPHSQPDRAVWEGVWDSFDRRYNEPKLNEGFNKIIKLKIKDVTCTD